MPLEISCLIKYETDDAILVYDYAREEEIWFPLSQVDKIKRNQKGEGSITVTDWIARQKEYDV